MENTELKNKNFKEIFNFRNNNTKIEKNHQILTSFLANKTFNASPLSLGKNSNFQITDPEISIMSLIQALLFLSNYSIVSKKAHILFLNTNPEFNQLNSLTATQCHQVYINNKWVGGTLTNWKQISKLIESYLEQKYSKLQKKRYFEKLNVLFQGFDEKKILKNLKLQKALITIKHKKLLKIPRISKLKKFKTNPNLKVLKNKKLKMDRPNVLVVLNPDDNRIAIKEATFLKIPVIAFVNSNSNLKGITFPIICNNKDFKFLFFALNFIVKILNIQKISEYSYNINKAILNNYSFENLSNFRKYLKTEKDVLTFETNFNLYDYYYDYNYINSHYLNKSINLNKNLSFSDINNINSNDFYYKSFLNLNYNRNFENNNDSYKFSSIIKNLKTIKNIPISKNSPMHTSSFNFYQYFGFPLNLFNYEFMEFHFFHSSNSNFRSDEIDRISKQFYYKIQKKNYNNLLSLDLNFCSLDLTNKINNQNIILLEKLESEIFINLSNKTYFNSEKLFWLKQMDSILKNSCFLITRKISFSDSCQFKFSFLCHSSKLDDNPMIVPKNKIASLVCSDININPLHQGVFEGPILFFSFLNIDQFFSGLLEIQKFVVEKKENNSNFIYGAFLNGKFLNFQDISELIKLLHNSTIFNDFINYKIKMLYSFENNVPFKFLFVIKK